MNRKGILKALVIRDGKNRLGDMADVLTVARAEAKKILHTHNEVRVVDIIHTSYGWIAVFEVPGRL